MNEEEEKLELKEQELWQSVAQSEGVERANALSTLSKMLWNKNKYQDSLTFCQTARDIYLEAGKEDYSRELINVTLGIINNLSEMDKARETAEAYDGLIELFRETDDPNLGEALRDQGRYWFRAKEYQKSLDCHRAGMAFLKDDITDLEMGIDNLNVSMTLKHLKKFDEAITHLKEALVFFKKEKNPFYVSRCHGELSEIYQELENADELERWSRLALDYAELTNSTHWKYALNHALGFAAQWKGDLDKAEEYFLLAKEIEAGNNASDWPFLVENEKALAGIATLRGEDDRATEILRRVSTIEETIKDEEVA